MNVRNAAAGVVTVGIAAAALIASTNALAVTPASVWITAGSTASGTVVNFGATGGAITLQALSTGFSAGCVSSNLIGGTIKTGSGQGPNGTPGLVLLSSPARHRRQRIATVGPFWARPISRST